MTPRVSAGIVIGMLAMMVLPATLALRSVRVPARLEDDPNASPDGYTWSLLLFVVPIVGIAGWFLPSEGLEVPHKAFWRTIGILVPIGCLLDFVFAQWFFIFPNPSATLEFWHQRLDIGYRLKNTFFISPGSLRFFSVYLAKPILAGCLHDR